MKKTKHWLIYLFVTAFVFSACDSAKKDVSDKSIPQKKNFDYSSFKLKSGDILFQDSDCGPFCDAIEKVTEGIGGAKFSHVGLVINNDKGDLVILEAISAGVVETASEDFFGRSFDGENNSKVIVGRLKNEYQHLIPQAVAFSRSKLGYAYDDVFDILNNKYYCSELIYDAFQYANNNQPIFQLQEMTFKDPETNTTFPIWEDYFKNLNVVIPEGEPGLNPGSISRSNYIEIVHLYGKPQGLNDSLLLVK